MKRFRALHITLLAAVALFLFFLLFGHNFFVNRAWHDEVHTLSTGVTMLVPAGWEIPQDQLSRGYWTGTIEYTKFNINTLSSTVYDRMLAWVMAWQTCRPDIIQKIYEEDFANPELAIQQNQEKRRSRYERSNQMRAHYDPKDEALLWYEAEHTVINGVPVFSEKYVAREEDPYTRGMVNKFRWYVVFYTPKLAFRQSAHCKETDRERFEPIFETIFNSVTMPAVPNCNN